MVRSAQKKVRHRPKHQAHKKSPGPAKSADVRRSVDSIQGRAIWTVCHCKSRNHRYTDYRSGHNHCRRTAEEQASCKSYDRQPQKNDSRPGIAEELVQTRMLYFFYQGEFLAGSHALGGCQTVTRKPNSRAFFSSCGVSPGPLHGNGTIFRREKLCFSGLGPCCSLRIKAEVLRAT